MRDSRVPGPSHLRTALLTAMPALLVACAPPERPEPSFRADPADPGSRVPGLSTVAGEILDLFDEADLVCLGETHGSLHDAALRQALVEHPRFASTVDAVVVEFANPVHRPILDRWILGGETLPRRERAPTWRDAGLGRMWELPFYEAFFESFSRANAELPSSERVRVIGAALPIDWRRVERPHQLLPYLDRRGHFEALLRQQLVTPGRKTLAIFGVGHCERLEPSVFDRIVTDFPERTRAAFGFEAARGFEKPRGVEAGREAFGLGPEPRLVRIRGTDAADWPTGEMFFEGHHFGGARIGDLVDAIVYYGEGDDTLLGPADLGLDPELEAELDRRARLWSAAASL